MAERLRIDNPINPYSWNAQGKANEPITVAALLDRAKRLLGEEVTHLPVTWTLDEIYTRLEENAPRIAILGGSWDHPAHVMDLETVCRAAMSLWQRGAVPFYASTPVLCDGTAQSTMGMSYSLQSRNLIAGMVVNHLEAQSYHGAFVIQSCDKQPLAVVSGLAHLDRLRRYRGEAPIWATFAPVHVLKGGTIPLRLKEELLQVAQRAEGMGHGDIADDLRDAMSYILQCSSNTAFQGVFLRAVAKGIISAQDHKRYQQVLAVNTCDAAGGICAFHGTGNSSRDLVSGFGLVHPEVELLTAPPTYSQVDTVVNSFLKMLNKPEFSVAELLKQNVRNAVRLHSAAGGSTNLVMHLVGAMVYAGIPFSVMDMEKIRLESPVPDLFDYSLTEGRDVFALAEQCASGYSRGMETLMYELLRNGVPMDVDARTVTGGTWRDRLLDRRGLAASNVKHNPIIVDTPRRPFSGVDILTSNFFESAVVKISGMSNEQLDEFDEKLAMVVYYENEDEANRNLLDVNLTDKWKKSALFHPRLLEQLRQMNGGNGEPVPVYEELFDKMLAEGLLKVLIVIGGQGPDAFGMPEMFTPMQHINANRTLQRLTVLISDGRYSGVTYGAAIGHVTPEAIHDGGLLYLMDGDVVQLGFRKKSIQLLDPVLLAKGEVRPAPESWRQERRALAEARRSRLIERRRRVAASNRLYGCTDAAHGVVPLAVWEEAAVEDKEMNMGERVAESTAK